MYLVIFSGVCRVMFFFFKQKTAYEMRISDWSSDVCSSDLLRWFGRERRISPGSGRPGQRRSAVGQPAPAVLAVAAAVCHRLDGRKPLRAGADGAVRRDRKSVVWGKRVSVRVDLGGCRIIKKKKKTEEQYR